MHRLGRLSLSTVLTVALAIGVQGAAWAAQTPVSLSFTGFANGQSITTVTNDGTGATAQTVVRTGGGRAVARWSHINSGIAARLPAYDGAADGARAVIAVTNVGDTDVLAPGAGSFSFGADVKVDDTSSGTTYDDGNNVVQRGLATEAAQYKLQLDDGRFSCRVEGDDGMLYVSSSRRTATRTWYHAACKRRVTASGDYLVLWVAPIKADGSRGTTTTNVSPTGPCGTLSFALATPLSVGGKLVDATTPAPNTDQLNGVVDSVFFKIG